MNNTSGTSLILNNGDLPLNDQSLTIQQAQAFVDKWITTIGVRYFSPLTNMAVLTEEVGEVARIMARKYGDQSFKKNETDSLADELADVLWVLMAIANQTGVDLAQAFKNNIDKKTKRDATRHRDNPKLQENN
jgi:NTP pyrophosphatase (non-canonical NTP hydrolase)